MQVARCSLQSLFCCISRGIWKNMCLGCNVVFQLATYQTNKAVHLLKPGCAIGAFHLQWNTVFCHTVYFHLGFVKHCDAQQGAVTFHHAWWGRVAFKNQWQENTQFFKVNIKIANEASKPHSISILLMWQNHSFSRKGSQIEKPWEN